MNLYELAAEISRRVVRISVRDQKARRPLYGGTQKFQDDPHWKDYILYYEYFHGENGAGLGASDPMGWTGLIARSRDLFSRLALQDALRFSKDELAARMTRDQVMGTWQHFDLRVSWNEASSAYGIRKPDARSEQLARCSGGPLCRRYTSRLGGVHAPG